MRPNDVRFVGSKADLTSTLMLLVSSSVSAVRLAINCLRIGDCSKAAVA